MLNAPRDSAGPGRCRTGPGPAGPGCGRPRPRRPAPGARASGDVMPVRPRRSARSAARVSLRPKPSVPSVDVAARRPTARIRSGTART
ncbi:MAG: hypothetical protein MZW92_58470 [Comamonadaceae bacterium]|nr:hypothetical protein [Comamonadaceae bacterium]